MRLLCPGCGRERPAEERFCESCGLPLVQADRAAPAERDRRTGLLREDARQIDPRYTEGELVPVFGAGSQAEAEMIQGLLRAEGIPSVRRPAAPDFVAAGTHQVLVPASGAQAARRLLRQGEPGG